MSNRSPLRINSQQRQNQLHSQIGFYRLPPGYTTSSRKTKRARRRTNRYNNINQDLQRRDKAWASNNELDAILEEVSEESAISSPGPSKAGSPHTNGLDLRRRSSSYDDLKAVGEQFWSSPTTSSRLIGSKTPEPGLFGKQNKPLQVRSKTMNNLYPEYHRSDRLVGKRDPPSPQVAKRTDFFEKCFHPHAKVCHNIKYNLAQLRKHSQKAKYMSVVDAISFGPESVRANEAERILGINQEVFLKSKARRKEDAGNQDGELPDIFLDEMETLDINHPVSNNLDAMHRHSKKNKYKPSQHKMGLHELFSIYARWGDPYSTDHHMTLSQVEKWLSQADILDNWNVTTTDTALSFRKISRGSKRIDYETFRHFLEEFAWRKSINHDFMLEKLCTAGKPSNSKIYSNDVAAMSNHRNRNVRPEPDPFYVLPSNDNSYYHRR